MSANTFEVELGKNTKQVLDFVKSIAGEHLAKQPEGKWNIIQILEHIYITEKIVTLMLYRPSELQSSRLEIVGNEKLKRAVVGLRNRKVQSPEMFHPKGKIKSIGDFEKLFYENRKSLKLGLISGKIPLDNRVQKHPYLGEMTITDWLNFIPLHTQRHLEQIKDIITMG